MHSAYLDISLSSRAAFGAALQLASWLLARNFPTPLALLFSSFSRVLVAQILAGSGQP
jgi:hypothetical protein